MPITTAHAVPSSPSAGDTVAVLRATNARLAAAVGFLSAALDTLVDAATGGARLAALRLTAATAHERACDILGGATGYHRAGADELDAACAHALAELEAA